MFEPKEVKKIIPLRKCHCGSKNYGFVKAGDGVHCYNCGTLYLIGPKIIDPAVKFEYVKREKT